MSYPAPRRSKAVIIAFFVITALLHWLLLFGGLRVTQRLLPGSDSGPLNIEVVLAAPVVAPPPPKPAPPPPLAPVPKPAPPPKPVLITPPVVQALPPPAVEPPAPLPEIATPSPEPVPTPPPEPPVDAVAITLPARATLTYDVGYGTGENVPRQASSITRWTFESGKYSIESVAEAAGLVRLFYGGQRIETSRGSIAIDGLAPEKYSDVRPKRKNNVYFAREAKTITFSEPAGNTVPLPAGVQDRLSVQFQLGAILQARPQLRAIGTRISIRVAGLRNLDEWTFVVKAQETLQIDGADVPALRLIKDQQPGRDYDRAVELWLAPAMNWLPARIRISEPNGRTLEQRLVKVES
jgi:hypothetical protein